MQHFMYEEEQTMFRDAFREYLKRDVAPYEEEWTEAGVLFLASGLTRLNQNDRMR